MDAEILDDLKQINVQLIKQEQNIQHIQQIQSRVSEQFSKTGTALKKTSVLLGGFRKAAVTTGNSIIGAFSSLGAGEFLAEAVTGADALADKFLVLRLSLGKLKSAIGEAVAPIVSAFLPMVQQAVYAATRWVKSVGKVVAALFGGTVQTEDMAAAQEQLAVSSGKAARSLASFDEIERLDKGSGSSAGTVESVVTIPKVEDALSPQLQAVADNIRAVLAKIKELLAPLRKIDFTPAAQAFSALGRAAGKLGSTLAKKLEWAWHDLLVPLGKWKIETAVPAGIHTVTAAFSALTEILKPLSEGFQSFLPVLTPMAQFLGQQLTQTLDNLGMLMREIGRAFTQESENIKETCSTVGEIISRVWTWIEPLLASLGQVGEYVMTGLAEKIRVGIGDISQTLNGLATFVAGVFSADWERAWGGLVASVQGVLSFLSGAFLIDWTAVWTTLRDGAVSVFSGLGNMLKTPINGIIGVLNGLLSGVTGGINAMIRGLNTLSFTIPDWVPLLGGESFGFDIATVQTPQIPYLAQGAVLPANKPFLAVVGDQKSGTNIEAPLSVIQEAVASVMDGQVSAMLSGFEALLAENRQLRAVVESIEVGDTVIGQAAQRYDRRCVLARGGVL